MNLTFISYASNLSFAGTLLFESEMTWWWVIISVTIQWLEISSCDALHEVNLHQCSGIDSETSWCPIFWYCTFLHQRFCHKQCHVLIHVAHEIMIYLWYSDTLCRKETVNSLNRERLLLYGYCPVIARSRVQRVKASITAFGFDSESEENLHKHSLKSTLWCHTFLYCITVVHCSHIQYKFP